MMHYGRNWDWRTRQASWWHCSDSLPNVYLWPWREDSPLWCCIFWNNPQATLMKWFRWTYSIFSICFTPQKTVFTQIIWRMWFQDFDSTHKGFWCHILLSGVQHIDGKGKNSIKRILLVYSLHRSPHAEFSKASVIYTGKRCCFL